MIALNLEADCHSKPNLSLESSDKLTVSPPYEYTYENTHSKCLKYYQLFIQFFSLTMTICFDCKPSTLLKTGVVCIKYEFSLSWNFHLV